MEKCQEIHFGDGFPSLEFYESKEWRCGEEYRIEFFPGKLFDVMLTSIEDERLGCLLGRIDDRQPIALDLEWEDELCLFQFCSSKGVLIVRHERREGDARMRVFFETHRFFAKGTSNDRRQLRMKFGSDFGENIEDIAETRLVPYGHSKNFGQMTVQFAGHPSAGFKDVRITTSNWACEVLSMRQVLYAAFDVVAIYACYPNFPPQ